MMTLNEIAVMHQTDRASEFSRTYGKPHDYARHYDKVFSSLRHEPVKFLEIGVGGGEGILMWSYYFDRDGSLIFGVDNQHDTNPFNTPGKFDRYTFVHGDQGKPEFWGKFITDNGGDFDAVVDDGSHINTDIITTFIALWQHVKPGGFYAIEDLATGYGGDSFFVNPNLPSHIDFLKGKLDELNRGVSDIDSIYWAKELAIIRKKL